MRTLVGTTHLPLIRFATSFGPRGHYQGFRCNPSGSIRGVHVSLYDSNVHINIQFKLRAYTDRNILQINYRYLGSSNKRVHDWF
jgi:hypothetical protein